MTATDEFISGLEGLKRGDLGRLRQHAGLPLDSSVDAFDLFAGLWWPLRRQSQRAPRREVAWLVAKLYAFCPIRQQGDATIASSLGKIEPADQRVQQKFDELLTRDLRGAEPLLQWALALTRKNSGCVDWVQLTDDLSAWEGGKIRRKWAQEFLQSRKGFLC